MMKRILYIGVVGVVLGVALIARAEMVDRIIAIVNEDVVTQYDFDRALALHTSMIKKAKLPTAMDPKQLHQQILEGLINQKLMEQEIKKANIKVEEDELARSVSRVLQEQKLTIDGLRSVLASKGVAYETFKEQLSDDIRQMKFIQEKIGSLVQVSDKDIENYKLDKSLETDGGVSVRLSWIFIPLKEDATDKEIKEVTVYGRKVSEKARQKENFGKILKKYSKKYHQSYDGEDKAITMKEVVASIVPVVRKMEVGSVSDPIVAPQGIYVVKLFDRSLNASAELANADDMKIRAGLYNERMEQEIQNYMVKLRRKAFVEILDE